MLGIIAKYLKGKYILHIIGGHLGKKKKWKYLKTELRKSA